MLFKDGTLIKFPPHLARELIQVVKPDDRVRANGYFEAKKLFKGYVIANPDTGRALREIKPTPLERASALAPLQPLSVAGTIRALRPNPHGDTDGAILEDGTLLQFPPHAGRQFAELLREQASVAAICFGTANDLGRTIAIAMLGPSADRLTLVKPAPAKPRKRPDDRKGREEEA